MAYVYLILLIVFTALGQVSYKKYYANHNKAYYFTAILLFLCLPFINYLALKRLPLDIVYINSACIIITINLMSYYFLKERLSKKQIIGIGLIIVGLVSYSL